MNESDRVKEVFSWNLSKFMRLNKLNQEEIAKIAGVSQQSVSNWLNCKQIPRMGIIEILANKFGVLKSELLENNSGQIATLSGYRIPILGSVTCGLPIEAIENIIDYIEVSESIFKKGTYFGLRAKGDSMSPLIYEGDTLIVKQQDTVESGQIAIVIVNGDEATCKKIMISRYRVTLIPLNPSYEPVIYDEDEIDKLPVSIVGRVVEIRRNV